MNKYELFESLFPIRLKRIYKDRENPTDYWEELPDSIIDVCLDLRSSINGSSDPWPKSFILKVVDMLKKRIEMWGQSKDEIDMLIKIIVINSISIGEKELERDWDFHPEIEKNCY